mgnify:FL=1
MMNQKRYVSAQELLNDSHELGIRIFKSGFKPSFIIGVWRDGISRIIMQRTSFQTNMSMRLTSGWFFPTNWKASHLSLIHI